MALSDIPTDYAGAEKTLGVRAERQVANHTRLRRVGPDAIALRYWDTDVVVWERGGCHRLTSGGWHTFTTKLRISQAISGAGWSLFSHRGKWRLTYCVGRGSFAVLFTNGCKVWPDGSSSGTTPLRGGGLWPNRLTQTFSRAENIPWAACGHVCVWFPQGTCCECRPVPPARCIVCRRRVARRAP